METKNHSNNLGTFDVSEKVMQEIRTSNIKMRPRMYFVAANFLLRSTILGLLAAAIFFAGLAFFKLRFYAPFGYLIFGSEGFEYFIKTLPWQILSYVVLCEAAGLLIVRGSHLLYKNGLMPVTAALAVITIVGGVSLDNAGVNEPLRRSERLPFLYKGEFITEYWIMGKIIAINNQEKKINIITPNSEKATILWNDSTNLPGGSNFTEGDVMQAIGDTHDNIFYAKGIAIVKTSQDIKSLYPN